MPKSKLRKNHKQKVKNYQQTKIRQQNELVALNDMLYSRLQEYNMNAQREHIVELAYTDRNDLVIEKDGAFALNPETVAVDDQTGVLVWKEDLTSIFAKYETETNVPFYTATAVTEILTRLYEKVLNERNNPVAETDNVTEAEVTEVTETK